MSAFGGKVDIKPGVPFEYYKPLIDLYRQQLQDDWDRNPYNWLASISAQTKAQECRRDYHWFLLSNDTQDTKILSQGANKVCTG